MRQCITIFVMSMFYRRIGQSNSVYVVVSLLLAAGFIIQLKVLYHSHQKNLRFADYSERVDELSDNMKSVGRIANVTSELLKKLEASLKTKRLTPKVMIS